MNSLGPKGVISETDVIKMDLLYYEGHAQVNRDCSSLATTKFVLKIFIISMPCKFPN